MKNLCDARIFPQSSATLPDLPFGPAPAFPVALPPFSNFTIPISKNSISLFYTTPPWKFSNGTENNKNQLLL